MSSDTHALPYSSSTPSSRWARTSRNEDSDADAGTAPIARDLTHEDKRRVHLLSPVDPPTWGPDWIKRDRRARPQAFVPGDRPSENAAIHANLDKSRQVARYKWLYALAAIIALGICGLAMLVDYSIINGDVWTRALANEYMQVPPALQNSVIFKSLQVIFAVLAVHFMLKLTGKFGRTVFVTLAFVLTILMVGCLGYLVAYNNLDMGTARLEHSDATTADDATSGSSIDRLLQSVGQPSSHQTAQPRLQPAVAHRTEAAAASTAAPAEFALPLPKLSEQSLANAQGWFWFGFASVIFLIVTTVCALYMQTAENNIRNWLIARDYRVRHREFVELAGEERRARR